MRKRFLGLLLALCMALALVPSMAFAANDPKLIVDGVNLVEVANHQITCSGGGTATFDPDTRTLTLNNATITQSAPGTIRAGIYIDEFGGDFTVKLIGENKIHFTDRYLGVIKTTGPSALRIVSGSEGEDLDSLDIVGYAKKGTLESPHGVQNREGDIFIGRVKLSVSLAENSRPNGAVIDAEEGAIVLDGTTLEMADYENGLFTQAAEIKNSKITMQGKTAYESIYTDGDLTILDSDVNVHSEFANAICCCGELTISGGKLTATAEDEYPALYGGDGITLKNGADVTAIAPAATAISAGRILNVESGKLTAIGCEDYCPIFVSKLDASDEEEEPADDDALIVLGDNIMTLDRADIVTSDWEYDSDEQMWRKVAYFDTTETEIAIDTAYIVTYAPGANGQGTEQTDIKIKDADLALKDALFTRDGFTQIGWATTENAKTAEYALGGKYTAAADVTLYPVWRDDHTHLDRIAPVAPTTEAEGNIEHWRCRECGKLFSDKDGKNEIRQEDTVLAKLTPSGENAPKTEDNANGVWVVLFTASGALLGAAWLCEKRRKNSRSAD